MNVPNEFTEFFQGIDLTKREIAFLIWLTEWDQNTIRNMRTVLEKVRRLHLPAEQRAAGIDGPCKL